MIQCPYYYDGQSDKRLFLPEVREFIKDTRPKTNTTLFPCRPKGVTVR